MKKKFCENFLNKIVKNLQNSTNYIFKNNEHKMQYSEANKKIKKILNFLNSLKDKKIIVFSDKSPNYYLMVLSIILSGKTWIQISSNIPKDRIKKIVKASGAKLGYFDESFKNDSIKKKLKINKIDLNKIFRTHERNDL